MKKLTIERALKLRLTDVSEDGTVITDAGAIMAIIRTFAIERDSKVEFMDNVIGFLKVITKKDLIPESLAIMFVCYADTFIGSKMLLTMDEELQEAVRMLRDDETELPTIEHLEGTN